MDRGVQIRGGSKSAVTPASTNDFHLFHRTKLHSTKPPLQTKKHLTKVDTNTPSTTNPPRLPNAKIDSETTFSGTTLAPFSKNVSTNIGHKFVSLIDKHFPKDHSLRKIFNRNTINISYSCTNNTKQIIDNHNKHILHSSYSSYTKDNKDGTRTNKTCNCRQKINCPLNGNCLNFNLQSFIKPPSHETTTTPLKHTLDSQKLTLKQDTEITPHHSATKTKTLPNLANTSGHSRTTTLTILFHGVSYHLALPTTAPVKDVTSA